MLSFLRRRLAKFFQTLADRLDRPVRPTRTARGKRFDAERRAKQGNSPIRFKVDPETLFLDGEPVRREHEQ